MLNGMVKMHIGCLKKLVTWSKAFLIVIICMCLSACQRSKTQAHALPEIQTPEAWQIKHQNTAINQAWLREFHDDALINTIKKALEHNFDLKMQLARWQQMQARSRISGAERKPQVSAGASMNRRYQENAFLDNYTTDYSVSLSLSWELDLWGKLSDRKKAALLLEDAAADDYQALRLSIAARVSQAWFACIHSQLQVQILNETVQAWDNSIRSAQSRFEAGSITALDLQRLMQARYADAASLSERKQEYENRKRDLEILIGYYPSAKIETAKALPDINDTPPANQPSSLITRRYDIASATRRFQAAELQFAAAKKDLVPSFRLTAEAGYASTELDSIFKPESLLWNALTGITAPLFQGGRLRATVDLRNAEIAEQAANWGKIVLNAFNEVETALSNEQYLRTKLTELNESVKYAERSHDQARQQFDNGLIGIVDVLDIKRNLLAIQVRRLAAKHALIANRIDLHRALGGDFVLEAAIDE